MKYKLRRRSKRLILIVIAVALIVSMLIKIFNDNISLFLYPADVYSKYEEIVENNKQIRIGGMVMPKSLHFDNISNKFLFVITDDLPTTHQDKIHHINVEFKGILPSLFREGQMTVVKGRIIKQNNIIHLSATEVLAKHDENYMPKPKKLNK